MRSILYWHPLLYAFFIKLSYKRFYHERYAAVGDLIAEGSSVVDICCGDCKIWNFLRGKSVRYLGLDFNPYFVKAAREKGIDARIFDIYKDEVPPADYLLMLGSLYQFIPQHQQVIEKLLRSKCKYLIISEAVRNYAHSRSKIVAALARMLNNPGDGVKKYRFTPDTFKEALRPWRNNIIQEFPAADNRDYVVVMRTNHSCPN